MNFYTVLSICVLVLGIEGKAGLVATRTLASRIIGGQTANAGAYPSAAAIYATTSVGTFFCGGSLLNQEYVITAAHCINGGLLFKVQLGSNSLSGTDTNRLTVSTSLYYIHPDFDADTLDNDIGLIKFHMPISYTDYIQPVYLPTVHQPDGMNVTAVGWGQISDSVAGLNNELNYVQLVTIPNDECQLSFGSRIHDNMVCVVGNYNEGSCRGDSGSAIMTTLNHHHWHVGVASFISTAGCESADPSGYTRTFPHVDWINRITTE